MVLIAVLGTSCTCEHDVDVVATTDDGSVRLTREYTEELGCGAAGGHGFGIIFPTVEDSTKMTLEIDKPPTTYKIGRTCGPGEAQIRLSDDKRILLLRCPEAKAWSVSYLPKSGQNSLDAATEFEGDEPPDWKEVPSLAKNIKAFQFGHLDAALNDVKRVDGEAAWAEGVAQTVSGSNDWDKHFEALNPTQKKRALKELARRLHEVEEPTRNALKRGAEHLAEAERDVLLKHLSRLAATKGDRRYGATGTACSVFRGLSEAKIDDLGPLACEMTGYPFSCGKDTTRVIAMTQTPCPEAVKNAYLTVCREPICDTLCEPEELPKKLEWAKENDGEFKHQKAVRSVYLQKILLNHPEERKALQLQLERSRYTWDQTTPCEPGMEKGTECNCSWSGKPAPDWVCQRVGQTEIELGRCTLYVDDEKKTITSRYTNPQKPRARPDAGQDMASD